jgi:hypothetical protein
LARTLDDDLLRYRERQAHLQIAAILLSTGRCRVLPEPDPAICNLDGWRQLALFANSVAAR